MNQYTSIDDVDAAVSSVKLKGGSCNVGAALQECKTSLFVGDAGGRKRVLLLLMAGKSDDDFSIAVSSLTTAGVKIIAVGIGALFDRSQLLATAFSSSYVQTTGTFGGLSGIGGSVSGLISQGDYSTNLLNFTRFE